LSSEVPVQSGVGVGKVRIAIDCLNCGHCASISEAKLPYFGLKPDTSLVTLTKRLTCKECGSKAVQAYRYIDDADGPPLAPR
jgi:hypothetical protein